MRKLLTIISVFIFCTLLIWQLGMSPKQNETFLQYLVFSAQLLYGNLCYDLMKQMKEIPDEDQFWSDVAKTSAEGCLLFVLAISSIIVAAKAFPLTYVAALAALLFYGAIFVWTLPKFTMAYRKAKVRLGDSAVR